MPRNGILWVAGGAALWGTDTVLRRLLAATLPPVQLVFYEHLLLAIVAVPLLWAHRSALKLVGPRHWLAILGLAWIGSAFPQYLSVAHLLVWQAVMILSAIVLWLLWMERLAGARHH